MPKELQTKKKEQISKPDISFNFRPTIDLTILTGDV